MGGRDKPKKSGANSSSGNLGKQIIRAQHKKGYSLNPEAREYANSVIETERGKHQLRSVTDCSDLEEFMAQANLADRDFTSERGAVIVLENTAEEHRQAVKADEEQIREIVQLPRRPPWDRSTTAAELDRREKESFLDWRRKLATVEEDQGLLLTPYERNLEVWRQLWRVAERSDLVVQIVDGRNPLIFWSEDLHEYVGELGKLNLLVINKADLLPSEVRQQWTKHLTARGVDFVFFSAHMAQEEELPPTASDVAVPDVSTQQEQGQQEERGQEEQEEQFDGVMQRARQLDLISEADLDALTDQIALGTASLPALLAQWSEAVQRASLQPSQPSSTHASVALSTATVFGRSQLLQLLCQQCPARTHKDGKVQRTIGLVGYPNVGKSSTLNALCGAKRVTVSATPGKTKHFQTLFVEDAPELCLCDCPGLVFPSLASTKEEMICDGILPIDQLRDYVPAMTLMCSRISIMQLEGAYGLVLSDPTEDEDRLPDAPSTARELCIAHASSRGWMTTGVGSPDEMRSARIILKDYVNGKLLHCHLPPDSALGSTHIYEATPSSYGRPVQKGPKKPTIHKLLEEQRISYDSQESVQICSAGGKRGKKGFTRKMHPGQRQ